MGGRSGQARSGDPAWFSELSAKKCWVFHQRTAVTVTDAHASFCLACAGITIDGVPITVGAARVA